MNKIRLKEDDEKTWRYALTVARSGCIISSTTNPKRASEFSDELTKKTSSYYTKRQEKLKGKEKSKKNTFADRKMQVEVF